MSNEAPPYTIKSHQRVGAGNYYRITHTSSSTKTPMTFGLFLPSRFASNVRDIGDLKENVPVMYWLSGLTCDVSLKI
jgi:S-formylglutathione hydrolase FrmB